VLTEYLVDEEVKAMVLARDGKLVIRPDSGDPADIICGHGKTSNEDFENAENGHRHFCECKGVIELLWDIFGGTETSKGYKILDEHIGCIYGDSITLERERDILARLKEKGFASTNIVLGVGSFTYQFNTRDTFGFAMKATYAEVRDLLTNEVYELEIFKDPITDDGTKKSARGLLMVDETIDGNYELVDQVEWEEEGSGALKTIFLDGSFENKTTLTEVRERLAGKIPELMEA